MLGIRINICLHDLGCHHGGNCNHLAFYLVSKLLFLKLSLFSCIIDNPGGLLLCLGNYFCFI